MTKTQNPWIDYVRNYRAANPELTWGEALEEAAPLYSTDKITDYAHHVRQTGGFISQPNLEKMLGLTIKFLGTENFYGLDPKTIINLMTFLFQSQDFAVSLSRITDASTTGPWTESISSISFAKGPDGVKEDMHKVFKAIDDQPDSQKIYKTLCIVYRDILFDSTGIFSSIIGTLYPATGDKREAVAVKTEVIRAIQGLNFQELSAVYYDLPDFVQALLEEPEKLRGALQMVLMTIGQNQRLRLTGLHGFLDNYLSPSLNTAIDSVQQVLPLTFAMLLLLDRCKNGLTEAQDAALETLIPPTTTTATTTATTSGTRKSPQRPLPERPLPERPLPERPLPERPLPERPLPERPLPAVPRNRSVTRQSRSWL